LKNAHPSVDESKNDEISCFSAFDQRQERMHFFVCIILIEKPNVYQSKRRENVFPRKS